MAKTADKTATPKAAPKAAAKAPSKAPAPAKSAADAAPAKAKQVAPPKAGNAPNALQKPLKPSPELGAIVGEGMLPRGEMVSKVWEYIKKHNLQNPANKREILADEKLKKVFGRDSCTMFEMNKYLAKHLT